MAKSTKKEQLDVSTEEKIKRAALKLFTKKGFAATRTRDISQEAGINLALLNYYFRSKEKLFELVMTETLQDFFQGIAPVFNDEATSVEEKITWFVEKYTMLLKQQPDLPVFIFHEIRMNPGRLAAKTGVESIFKSFFIRQLQEETSRRGREPVKPLHYVINMIGMCVFPFIAAPMLKQLAGMDDRSFGKLIDERKALVPYWMKVIMKH